MEKTRIIETKIGKVQGIIEENTEIFRGIPYAENPVGELRFKHTSPPKKWDDILQADDFGPLMILDQMRLNLVAVQNGYSVQIGNIVKQNVLL
ncbi:MAG: carboxylesterase family protein [Promethearchaeota archaeon]